MDFCETVSLQSEENEAKMLYTTILDEQQLPQFKCLKCGLTYIREYVMKNHIKIHFVKREKFKCGKCEKSFNRKASVREHIAKAHQNVLRHFCFVCKKGFYARADMLRHLNVHDGAQKQYKRGKPPGHLPQIEVKPLMSQESFNLEGRDGSESVVCNNCGRNFSSRQKQTRHICKNVKKETFEGAPVKNEGPNLIGCVLDCSRKFMNVEDFDLHMDVGDHDGNFFFTCTTCPKKFASTKALKGHICCGNSGKEDRYRLDETQIQAESLSKTSSANVAQMLEAQIEFPEQQPQKDPPGQNDSDENVQNIDVKVKDSQSVASNSSTKEICGAAPQSDLTSHSCKKCGRKLSSEKKLEIHLRIHQEQSVKVCRSIGCMESFETQDLLNEHKFAVHGIVGTHVKEKCKICDKMFRKMHMSNHKLRHSNEKNFVCNECGKRFKRKNSLDPHMLIHQGTKNFHCDQCGQDFFSRPALTNHINNKHNQDNPIICSECGKNCGNKYNLISHMARHTGEKKFACRFDGCKTKMRLAHMRTVHEKIHTGIKDHQCTICPKAFVQKTALVQHLKRHRGIKDFKCATCGRAFVEPAGARQCKHTGQTSRSDRILAKT